MIGPAGEQAAPQGPITQASSRGSARDVEHTVKASPSKDRSDRSRLELVSASRGTPGLVSALERLVGSVLAGRYRIDSLANMGSQFAVFRGTHLHQREPVAIKLPFVDYTRPASFGRKDVELARAAARREWESLLRHRARTATLPWPHDLVIAPNPLLSSRGSDPVWTQELYLVEEWIDGVTFDEVRQELFASRRSGEEIRGAVLPLILSLLSALARFEPELFADVSPRNFLWCSGVKTTRLVDAGNLVAPGTPLWVSEPAGGKKVSQITTPVTLPYLPADDIRAFRLGEPCGVRASSVIFALGKLFHELVTNLHPLNGQDPSLAVEAYTSLPKELRAAIEPLLSGTLNSMSDALAAVVEGAKGGAAMSLRFEVTQQGDLASYSLDDELSYLLVTLHPHVEPAESQPPVETIFLMDCGGSMSAQRERQIRALSHFLRALPDLDSVAVILFAGGSTLFLPLTTAAALRADHGSDILSRMRTAEVRLGQERRMAPALVRALEHFASRGAAGSVRRICCLTDRVADDVEECAKLLGEHRSLALHAYDLGMSFDALRIARLLANSPFGVAEHVPYDLDIESAFTRLARGSGRSGHSVKLAVSLAPDVIGGSLFQYDPSESVLGSMDASQVRWHDLGEDHFSSSSLLFEVRLPAVVAEGRTRIGTFSLWYRGGERGLIGCQEVELTVERTKAPGAANEEVGVKRDLLLAIRDGNTGAQTAMYEAQLHLYRQENRDPMLIAAIERKLWSLRDPGASAGPDDAEAAYLESHPTTSKRIHRRHQPKGPSLDDPPYLREAVSAVEGSVELAVRHAARTQDNRGAWGDIRCTSWMLRAFGEHPDFAERAAPPARRFLLQAQNRDGGWAARPGAESDNETTACVLLALRDEDDMPTLISVDAGLKHLLARQREDGLWTTGQGGADDVEADCVAHVIAVISAFYGARMRSIRLAQTWLEKLYEAHERWTAGFHRGLPYSTLEVSRGLRGGHPIVYRAARSLRALQNPDGGFPPEPGEDSTPSATGLSLAALSDHHELQQPFMRRALRFLCESQRSDGTWPSEREIPGPRPPLRHAHLITHAFASMGLMKIWQIRMR